jgi:hypothetical protein
MIMKADMSNVYSMLSNGLASICQKSASLLRITFVVDGLFCAFRYLKYATIFKDIRPHPEALDALYKSKALTTVYSLTTVERYVFYSLLYGILKLAWSESSVSTLVLWLVTVPSIQNTITNNPFVKPWITQYRNHLRVMTRYALAKMVGWYLSKLGAYEVKRELHIFALYKLLTPTFLFAFIRSYVIVFALYNLRTGKMTYYYYKAAKLAYYYNTGYLFNVMDPRDATFLINHVIKEAKWKRLTSIEVVNAFHVLTTSKGYFTNITRDMYFGIVRFFSVWSCLSVLTIVKPWVCATVLIIAWAERVGAVRLLTLWVPLYIMISHLGVHEVWASLFYIWYKWIALLGREVWYYVKNRKDIHRMIQYMERDQAEQEYILL